MDFYKILKDDEGKTPAHCLARHESEAR